ncbi:helix-turn-helix domain-containing protein [Ancylobacter terrae]|uniref:helix-turn-helix domain-containing protein n=1 Tax=Ancylobacter sp. sgz301288 TaxID=3342077 RepID=UPI00385F0763
MKHAAIYCGLSPRGIAGMIADGRLPSIKIGRRRLILIEDLNAMLHGSADPLRRVLGDRDLSADEARAHVDGSLIWWDAC